MSKFQRLESMTRLSKVAMKTLVRREILLDKTMLFIISYLHHVERADPHSVVDELVFSQSSYKKIRRPVSQRAAKYVY